MADDAEFIEIEADDTTVVLRSADLREIDVRLVPFNQTISTRQGSEEFAPGASVDTPADGLLLMGLEHEAGIGLGQDGRPVLTRRPVGRSLKVWEDEVGAYATFKVARTQAGDELLALAADKVIRGVSVEMDPARTISEKVRRAGKTVSRITRAGLTGAALTYRPAYGALATVTAMRTEEVPVSESQEAPATGLSQEDSNALVARMSEVFNKSAEQLTERLTALEEERRKDIDLPTATRAEDGDKPHVGQWASTVLRMLDGERIPKEQMRTLDDVITSDNLGVVPPAYLTELIGVIDASRPFLSSTRRLNLPASGLDLKVPKINQRPEVAVQTAEKQELASRKTLIGLETFSAVTIGGAADISIQLLKRSSPEFLALFIELLAEQYAIVSEDEAITALADAMGGFGDAEAMNPANLSLGGAYVTSFDAIRRPPDTIWMSTKAVGEFIDAKATTTNQPLYSSIQASATAAGGITGFVSGLRVVHVPILDAHGAYAIVGPSSGFAWTEDGTYTLQVDNPGHAGRDVAIVGLLFPAPWYPDAFTAYNVAS
jgi:HK97 family phage major capsid protein